MIVSPLSTLVQEEEANPAKIPEQTDGAFLPNEKSR